jgi:hypothetical protein
MNVCLFDDRYAEGLLQLQVGPHLRNDLKHFGSMFVHGHKNRKAAFSSPT